MDPFQEKQLWKATHKPPSVFVQVSEEINARFVEGYQNDPSFRDCWEKSQVSPVEPWEPENRFFKDESGLLYFRDTDLVARLCVPRAMQAKILRDC